MNDQDLIDVLLAAFESVCGTVGCSYVSGPLTTSREIYAALAAGVGTDALKVFERENRGQMREFADALRRRSSRPVIDTGLLHVPGWEGPFYGELFLKVLERYCVEAHFMYGWEYSRGATKEFVRANVLGIPCFGATGDPLSVEMGLTLMANALADLRLKGVGGQLFPDRVSSFGVKREVGDLAHQSQDEKWRGEP